MFHGLINRGGQWFRLLTSIPLFDGEHVVERFKNGPYKPAFLDHFFPGRYRVEARKLQRKSGPDASWSDPPITSGELCTHEVIRWSTASEQYMVMIKGAKGWLSAFRDIGLIVRNSRKMSKRLVELVRMTSMWLFVESGDLKVEVIEHEHPECFVDGNSSISRSLAIRCIKSNVEATRRWRAKEIWKIHLGVTTTVIFRMITPQGLIKGDALVLPRRMMNGFDVRTFEPNIKSEIQSSGWQWITIEPSYGVIPVKSDDLSHAIYRRVNGLYDDATLLASLDGMLKQYFDDLKEGKKSEWLTRLASSENVKHEDTEKRFAHNRGLVGIIQQRVAELHGLGIPLSASQTLMFLSVNGLSNMLLGKSLPGEVWKHSSRHWFPVPWAYAAHIRTKESLELFGFKMPRGDFGFYHKATHSFVVPGAFFQRNLANHGGADLDDTFKVHIRIIKGRLMAFLLRNPNDFGEWSMIPVRDPGPVFHRYTNRVPTVDYEELVSAVPQFTEIRDQLSIGKLPGVKKLKINDEFSLIDELRVRSASQSFPAGTGGVVLPKMIHAAIVGGHIPQQFASNEDIIDALQQGSATPEDVRIIRRMAEYVFRRLPKTVDAFWFRTRMVLPIVKQFGFSPGDESESPWVALHLERETRVRSAIEAMREWLNSNIVRPEVLANIQWTLQETASATSELNKIKVAKSESSNWVEDFVGLLRLSDELYGQERTNRWILLMANQALLHKLKYPKGNHDSWLYSFSVNSEDQPVDWFIRALRSQANRT